MNTLARVAAFLLVIVAVFGVALAAGAWVGPVGEATEAHASPGHAASGHAGHDDSSPDGADRGQPPGGLMVSSQGYTLRLGSPVPQAGRDRAVSFVIDGPGGPATAYDVQHGKRLHFIAVRRDFTGFQHVHPELAADGTWTTRLDLTPGQWRVFADFRPVGAGSLTLGADLMVPGAVRARAPSTTTRVAEVDGYTVTLTGDLAAGEHSLLRLDVARNGRPVTDLQPYLGAYGHLVALRGGDLAYLHVHPDGEPGDGRTRPGPGIEFAVEVPSPGVYHLYLDFRHGGVVRTAGFELPAGGRP
jgi:hypothetical protein